MTRVNTLSRFIELFRDGAYQNVPLGELCSKITDGSHNPPKGVDASEFLMISSQNVFSDGLDLSDVRYLSKEDFENEDKRTSVSKGDVLLTIVGTIGRVYQVTGTEGPIALQRSVAVLKPNDKISSRFLMVSFLYDDDFSKEGRGNAQKGVYLKQLSQYMIKLPSIEKQKEFEVIYQQADKSKFNCFKSRFIEMFGNPNSNPHCLPTELVSDLFTLQMGKTPARDTARYWVKDGSGNKWISIADMSRYEYFTNDTEEYISESAIQETGMKLIPQNTVIMSFKLTIGRVSVTSEPIYSNEAIVAFITKAQDYSTRFLYFLVKYYDWLENAALAVKGKTLNKESIGKNRLIIPSRESQNEFAAFAEQADKSKYMN